MDTLRPMVERYAEEVPGDESVQNIVGFLGKVRDLGRQGLVLVARTDHPVGFAVAQLFKDDLQKCLCAVIHTAWIDPTYRARGILGRALAVIEAWAREAGAAYMGCLSPKGTALARLLHWQRVGRYLDRDYLVHPIQMPRSEAGNNRTWAS